MSPEVYTPPPMLFRKFISGFTVGGMIIAGTIFIDSTFEGSIAQPKLIEPSCIDPTAGDFSDINTILDSPESASSVIAAYKSQHKGSTVELSGDPLVSEAVAESEGLTIFSDKAKQTSIALSHYSAEANDGSEDYLRFENRQAVANEFLALYGVDVSLGTMPDGYVHESEVPSGDYLDSVQAGWSLSMAAEAFFDMPKEFVDLVGLKHIVLTKVNTGDNNDPATNVAAEGDTIYVNMDAAIVDWSNVWSGMYTLLDKQQCSPDNNNDPAFVALNNGANIYGDDPAAQKYYKLEDPTQNSNLRKAEDKLNDGIASDDCDAAKYIDTVYANMVTYSDFHHDPATDKSELGKNIMDTSSYGALDNSNNGPMAKKFRFLLARLHAQDPAVARDFARLGAIDSKYRVSGYASGVSQDYCPANEE